MYAKITVVIGLICMYMQSDCCTNTLCLCHVCICHLHCILCTVSVWNRATFIFWQNKLTYLLNISITEILQNGYNKPKWQCVTTVSSNCLNTDKGSIFATERTAAQQSCRKSQCSLHCILPLSVVGEHHTSRRNTQQSEQSNWCSQNFTVCPRCSSWCWKREADCWTCLAVHTLAEPHACGQH